VSRSTALRQGQRKGDFLAGKYLLEDCLGIGGMGEVYRATNVSLGRKVAIKLLSPEYVNIEEDVLRFLREARAAAAVRHTNVVDVIDVARDDDGTPFIVQELLAGEDLERYLRTRERLSCEEALEIMIPVADAVAAAHAQNVVHRDLKPANIFLARDRNKITPKVLDFGACLFPTIAERSAKEIRMLIGTPHYMAPEQIVSKQDVDSPSDVWALGVILYEMIIGETPFEADSANAVLQLVKTRDVPPLRQRQKDAPRELEALIARCTQRDLHARFRNAGELHAEMLVVRGSMRGPASSRMQTLMEESPSRPASEPKVGKPTPGKVRVEPAAPAAFDIPSLDAPSGPRRGPLLTLSSPGSEPPPMGDISLSTLDDVFGVPASAQRAIPGPLPPPPSRPRVDPSGVRELDADDAQPRSFELAARPSSWPPGKRNEPSEARSALPSSLPPILDPSAFGALPKPPSVPPLAPPALPRELERSYADERAERKAEEASGIVGVSGAHAPAAPPKPAGPPPMLATGARSPNEKVWSSAEITKVVAAVGLPAVIAFAAVLVVPALGTPLGRALRGDSTLASGAMAVTALVAAAVLCARTMLGERRSRWLYVASGGSVLFGIVMIIVTFAASEAAELGVPQSMSGISTLIAPIAPLALALGAIAEARVAFRDPYARRDVVRFAAIASVMLLVTLVLSPIGAVRTPSRPPQALRGILGG
jgi:serine/threonine protein kinase